MRGTRMKLRTKLIVIGIAFISIILFLFREEFSEGIKFSEIKPIVDKEEINFLITSDIHYLSSKINDGGDAFKTYLQTGDSKQIDYINEITDAFVEDVINKKPEFLIISGDLTNNGEKESHLGLVEKLNKIEDAGIEIFLIPGNHDISNPWAKGFQGDNQYDVETVSKEEFRQLYNDFGYEKSISQDRDTLSYLVAPSKDLWLLMLDTNMYLENEGSINPEVQGEISYETYEWIKESAKLAQKNNARIVTVMHHNIIDHNETFNKGFTLDYNEKMIKRFRKSDINLVLSGHIHIQDIAASSTDGNKAIYDIATSSLSVYPQKYGELKYSTKEKEVKYTTNTVDVEAWANRTGQVDSNLIGFNKYSKEFFDLKTYSMAQKVLEKPDTYSEEEKDSMIKTLINLNERVFEGRDSESDEELINSEGYKLWLNCDSEFYRNYVRTSTKDNNLEDNSFKINISK